VSRFELSPRADARLDEIYDYSLKQWDEVRADRYLDELFDCFRDIALGRVRSSPIPAEFGVDGFYRRQKRHFIYWKRLANGSVGIVTILHDRMHQIDRFQEDAT
jgi:plasmid stabilization system protein ParE